MIRQTDLTAIRDQLLVEASVSLSAASCVEQYSRNWQAHMTDCEIRKQVADRLTAALGSLPVPDTEDLRELMEKWRYVATTCREMAEVEIHPDRAAALRTAAVNRDDCARDLEAKLSALLSRSAQEPPKDIRAEAQRIAEMREHTSSASRKERIEALTYDIVELVAVSRSRAPQEGTQPHEAHHCPEFGECWCESPERVGAGVDRGRTVVSGAPSGDQQGDIYVHSHEPPTWLCEECRQQWLASDAIRLIATSASPPAPEGEKP